jgi:hypothetical protein
MTCAANHEGSWVEEDLDLPAVGHDERCGRTTRT